ncbi:hypothetical protein CDD81_6083 [Ophiocordyceps australis]|uniref:Uncharacterized protein n=1 Tax=Ophiocordyceps australis TaxID=1399860 RepID=A0A2C5X9N4_9HYPO|nr:hypothetical protein CDD81_6083 [Ophiocordyceps australis]
MNWASSRLPGLEVPPTLSDWPKSGVWLPSLRTLEAGHDEAGRLDEPVKGPTSLLCAASAPVSAPVSPPASPQDGRRRRVSAAQRKVRFEQMREHLWRQGAKELGNLDHQDMVAFVVARKLQRPPCAPSSPGGANRAADKSRRPVRVVIHPQNGAPISLSRDFDLDKLRATIPDPQPCPRPPHYDRASLLAAAMARRSLLAQATSAVEKETCRDQGQASPRSRATRDKHGSCGPWSMPIHRDYARATLPMLASIMMSKRVSHRDRIDLPMPHPGAWIETAAYVYTGEQGLLTEHVRQNIVYLGGKV